MLVPLHELRLNVDDAENLVNYGNTEPMANDVDLPATDGDVESIVNDADLPANDGEAETMNMHVDNSHLPQSSYLRYHNTSY